MQREHIIYTATLALSAALHVGAFEGLGNAARTAPKPQRVLEFAVVKPPPPVIPPPEPEKPKPPPPPKPIDLTKVVPPPDLPPPPNTTEPPPTAEPPKPVFGISMSSVVGPGSGGFSVRVGNSLMKEPDKGFTNPADVQAYKPVPLHKVNKAPQRQGDCRGDYPAELRSLGIEGTVVLELEVKADGSVGAVSVKTGLGHGLDEAAVAEMKRCKFAPAEVGGQPVGTFITYRYTFVLEE